LLEKPKPGKVLLFCRLEKLVGPPEAGEEVKANE